jgi:hypothetical protein
LKQRLLIIIASIFLAINTKAQDQLYYGDTIRFENDNAFISLDTIQNNIWQIGEPQKNIFNAAYSPSRAILTDTIQSYSINNHSYFQVMVTQQNLPFPIFPLSIFLEFKHKINSDSLKDGGYITVSYDKGATWENVINSNPPFFGFYMNTNIYSQNDSLINGQVGFSGTDTTWKTTNIGWPLMGVKSSAQYDTILFRFNFISDSIQTNKDGWMIDDIRLYGVFYSEIEKKYLLPSQAFPNPCNQEICFTTNAQSSHQRLSIYNANSICVFQQNMGSMQTFCFDSSQLPNGIYLAKIEQDKFGTMLQRFVVQH